MKIKIDEKKDDIIIIQCPFCKSKNISDYSLYKTETIETWVIGSSYRPLKIKDLRCCNDCGIIFKPTKGNGL